MAKNVSASNVLDGTVAEIDRETPFANFAVDVGNGNYIYSNAKKEIKAYEDTLEDMRKTLGIVPDFMKVFPRELLVHDLPSWKRVGEIDVERARYLLSTDEMLEDMLGNA